MRCIARYKARCSVHASVDSLIPVIFVHWLALDKTTSFSSWYIYLLVLKLSFISDLGLT